MLGNEDGCLLGCSAVLSGTTTQKTDIFVLTAVRTSNPTCWVIFLEKFLQHIILYDVCSKRSLNLIDNKIYELVLNTFVSD
jgi:hypothetical protein